MKIGIPGTQQHYFTSAMVFGAIAAIGIALSLAAVEDFTYARTSYKWPTVEAVVLSSDTGKFRYAYFYDGASHEGRRHRFLFGHFLADGLTEPVPGDQISVSVFPGDPALVVVEPGGAPGFFAGVMALSISLVFIGLAGAIRAISVLDSALGEQFCEPGFGVERGPLQQAE